MKRIAMVVVAGMAVAGTAPGAGLYKCTDANGRAVFSQTQCAPVAEQVDVTVHQPTPEEIREHQRRLDEGAQWVEQQQSERAARIAARARAEAIEAVTRQHAMEQARIARQRSLTNNNMAGAVEDGAPSNDAAASDARYRDAMDRLTGR